MFVRKTLYISDLDGTLLDRRGELSDYTVSIIRRMIEEGELFTIATARSLQAAQDVINRLGLTLPAVLTNGATIYDPVGEEYIQVNTLPLAVLPRILTLFTEHNICGFLYTLRDNLLTVYFDHFCHEWDQAYHAHRVERYRGRFYQHGNLVQAARENAPVYMVAYGPCELLQTLRADLEHLHEITCELYSDVYNDYHFMDIFPSTASKATGMLRLQELTGADRLVAFGDNFNDLSMLLAADRAYVPAGGVVAAKNLATAVVDYAHRDGVAHFLARELGWEKSFEAFYELGDDVDVVGQV